MKDQHKLNKKIEDLIDWKDSMQERYTAEDIAFINQYAGAGGLKKKGAKGSGLLYEYYTSDPIIRKMWGLARKYGYDDKGAVLEPACGIGRFLKYAPPGVIVQGFEINPIACRIAQINFPRFTIDNVPFESLFFQKYTHLKNNIETLPMFHLVIGNPPYGDFEGRYAGMGEKKWTGAKEYDQYFMLRGIDLLYPGGLLVFIIPSAFLQNGHSYNEIKKKIYDRAELVDAYRLPSGVFDTTDIGTDIVVFKRR